MCPLKQSLPSLSKKRNLQGVREGELPPAPDNNAWLLLVALPRIGQPSTQAALPTYFPPVMLMLCPNSIAAKRSVITRRHDK